VLNGDVVFVAVRMVRDDVARSADGFVSDLGRPLGGDDPLLVGTVRRSCSRTQSRSPLSMFGSMLGDSAVRTVAHSPS
jgi:hypothetical protein